AVRAVGRAAQPRALVAGRAGRLIHRHAGAGEELVRRRAGLARIRARRAALAGDTVAGISRRNTHADPERAASGVAVGLADLPVRAAEAGDGVVGSGVARDDVGGRAAAGHLLVAVADVGRERRTLVQRHLEEGARGRVDEGI